MRLKKEIDELKNQLSISTGNAFQSEDLTQEEHDKWVVYEKHSYSIFDYVFILNTGLNNWHTSI